MTEKLSFFLFFSMLILEMRSIVFFFFVFTGKAFVKTVHNNSWRWQKPTKSKPNFQNNNKWNLKLLNLSLAIPNVGKLMSKTIHCFGYKMGNFYNGNFDLDKSKSNVFMFSLKVNNTWRSLENIIIKNRIIWIRSKGQLIWEWHLVQNLISHHLKI